MAELVKWLRRRTRDSAPRRSGGASRRTRALFSEKCSRMKARYYWTDLGSEEARTGDGSSWLRPGCGIGSNG